MIETPEAPPNRAQQRGMTADCCIVGAGPAGAVLALLLVRKGLRVTLLEAHGDFEREFRGDGLQPSVLEMMDELGLSDRLLELPHTKNHTLTARTPQGTMSLVDFSQLKSKFPFVILLPQARFLDFIIAEARTSPRFQLLMHARVESLIEEDGVVRGVRYRTAEGWQDVRARLTVGTDGRFSRIRRLAKLPLITHPEEVDILWLRVPRTPDDPADGSLIFLGSAGESVVALNRGTLWQIGYTIRSGMYQTLRQAGIERLREQLKHIAPELGPRFDSLQEWQDVAVLKGQSNRLKRWFKPGLLMLGDAAHTMSALGGVGTNYAIQDAVVAANVLASALKAGAAPTWKLALVQLHRELPIRVIQTLQTAFQRRTMAGGTTTNPQRSGLPAPLRFMLRHRCLRSLPTHVLAYGIWRVHVKR